ncbi:transglycosylase family protein [Gordonia sp. NPDC003585]|uniref:transglycosylase family protein n=1 Tax=Gordonia sp. NPDC003585 TaxID=3154275 RepID=UPI0033B25B2B
MTSPGGEWARARVGVELDWSGVDDELRRRLQRSTQIATRAAQRNFDQLQAHASRSFERMADAYERQLDRMRRDTRRAVTEMRRDLRGINTDLSVRVDLQSARAMSQLRALREVMQAYLDRHPLIVRIRIDESGLTDFRRQISQVQRGLGSRQSLKVDTDSKSLLPLIGTITKIAAVTGLATAALGGLGGAVGVAGGAVGALAGGFAALGATAIPAIATLTVGMAGLKDAAKAFNKQFEAENEAVLTRIGQMMGPLLTKWNSLSNTIKLNFATALQGGFANLTTLLGRLTPQIGQLATVLGQAGTTMSQTLLTVAPQLQTVIGGTISLVQSLTPHIAMATQQFVQMAANAAPAMSTIGAGLGNILTSISTAFASLDTSWFESFGQMLTQIAPALGTTVTAFTTLAQGLMPTIGPLLQSLATGIANMVPGLTTLGTSLSNALQPVLPVLGQLISDMATALAPALGPISDFLVTLGQALSSVMPSLGRMITSFVELAGPILGELVKALAPVVSALADGLAQAFRALQPAIGPISDMLRAVSPILASLAEQLGNILASALKALVPLLKTMGDAWTSIWPQVEPLIPLLGESLVRIIEALAPVIADMAKAWGDLIVQLTPLIPHLVKMAVELLPKMVDIVIQLSPLLLDLAQAFTDMIPYITPLIPVIGQVIDFVTRMQSGWLNFVSTVVGKIVEFATSVPENLGKVVGFIQGLPQRIRTAASGMWDGLKDAFRGAINWIVRKWNDLEFTVPTITIPNPLPGDNDFKIGGQKLSTPDIPYLRQGGLLAGGRFPLQPGGFVVNAAATARHQALLRALAPHGRIIRGAGSGTSDSIAGMFGGRKIAAVSNREFWVPPKDTFGILPILSAINGGGLGVQHLAAGGPLLKPDEVQRMGGGTVNKSLAEEVRRKFPDVAITSAKTDHFDDGGYHPKGMALDLDNRDDVAAWLFQNRKQLDLGQIIYGGGSGQWCYYNIGGTEASGKDAIPIYGSGVVFGDHSNHIHVMANKEVPAGAVTGGAAPSPNGLGNNLGAPSGGAGTPIGSGVGNGSGGSPSWGNSGGGSKFNSAEEADKAGVVPVWVENWPSNLGGGGSPVTPTLGGTPAPVGGQPSTVDTIPLKKNPDGTVGSTDPEWDKLMKRESGGRNIKQQIKDANSGGNEAEGYFQITPQTWAAHGGTKYSPTPMGATPEQQAEIAAKIFNKSGGSPWGAGAGQNFGRENEDALRRGIQRKGTGQPAPSTITPTLGDPNARPSNLGARPDQAKIDDAQRDLNLANTRLKEARDAPITGKTEKARNNQQAAKNRRIRRLEDDVRSAQRKLDTARGAPGTTTLGAGASNEDRANARVTNARAGAQRAQDRLSDAQDDLTRIKADPKSKPSQILAAENRVQDAQNALNTANGRITDAENKIGDARIKDQKKLQREQARQQREQDKINGPAYTFGGAPFSGQLGGLAGGSIRSSIDNFLAGNKGVLGSYDNTKGTSLGERVGGVADSVISGQLGSALGVFGLDMQPPIIDAIGQYQKDNPVTRLSADGKPQQNQQKNLTDMAVAIANGLNPIQIIINGNPDAEDLANRIDQTRRRRMRRYVK